MKHLSYLCYFPVVELVVDDPDACPDIGACLRRGVDGQFPLGKIKAVRLNGVVAEQPPALGGDGVERRERRIRCRATGATGLHTRKADLTARGSLCCVGNLDHVLTPLYAFFARSFLKLRASVFLRS